MDSAFQRQWALLMALLSLNGFVVVIAVDFVYFVISLAKFLKLIINGGGWLLVAS